MTAEEETCIYSLKVHSAKLEISRAALANKELVMNSIYLKIFHSFEN